VFVSVNYRLNIFAFGDGRDGGEMNLALQDQRLAIEWVIGNIAGFGGDPVSWLHVCWHATKTRGPRTTLRWRVNLPAPYMSMLTS
jgi:hypothetical protein